MNVDTVIKERTEDYGSYHSLANLSRTLTETTLKHYENTHTTGTDVPARLPHFMAEALTMINHKIARMANGNAFYRDNWLDIAGYAQLVVNALDQYNQQQPTAATQEKE